MKIPVVAANWKMYKTPRECMDFVEKLRKKTLDREKATVILFVPYTSLFDMGSSLGNDSSIGLGAQNVYWEQEGAFTGEVSTGMLLACGAQWVIVGHSERRTLFGESDEDVRRKATAALKDGLSVIFCLGESLDERERGETGVVIERQVSSFLSGLGRDDLRNVIFAYEPIWAIGTGLNATPAQVAESHGLIRDVVEASIEGMGEALTVLYGGSVNHGNCRGLSEVREVDGFLIGSASLDVDQFASIVETITEVKSK